MPKVQQYYDIEDTFGVAGKKRQIEELNMGTKKRRIDVNMLGSEAIGYNTNTKAYIRLN